MDLFLFGYKLDDPTWFYLSFLLIIAVFFKFNRLWSMRNVDLALLLSISPGLLLVRRGNESWAAFGYVWLFVVTALLLLRTLCDGLLSRRPRLEQNMNAAGMIFLCAAAFLFLTTKLVKDALPESTLNSIQDGVKLIGGDETQPAKPAVEPDEEEPNPAMADTAKPGPGTPLVAAGVAQISKVVAQKNSEVDDDELDQQELTARVLAVLAHLAIIVGLTLIGRHIYGDPDVGFAMATLYMLLPCTAFDVAKINHVLPAALVVWTIYTYRRPVVTGMLLGLASAMLFFPIFLLPLWISFYGRRGGLRFCLAVALTMGCIVSSLLLLSNDSQALLGQFVGYVPLTELVQRALGNSGARSVDFWGPREPAYIIPVFVTYVVMLIVLTVWPMRKSLSHVIPYSAALVIGTQFWYPWSGGVYVLWYLPLLLMAVFRPFLTNHFAPEVQPLSLFRRAQAPAESSPVLVASVGQSAYAATRF
ncbi:MAG: hypothetical protein JSS02_05645 [Planctomycetes bacterium]|nr:hypothetical protein [Planctomycetota bacterium]